ncbi:hypothetical protein Q3G72_028069 [Acer saccharum]|nr:hypothetical protein Q3G72_028069 [Acer saccharum]
MEKNLSPVIVLIILSVLPSITTAYLTEHELSLAISALRSRGYKLFPRAITDSDLRLRLLSSGNSTFTLFSPPDLLLDSLDLSFTATLYDRSLLCHVSPSKLTVSQLQNQNYLNTLLPHHRLLIGNTTVSTNGADFDSVTVDGVRLSVPDLFIGSSIAVHGLDGVLVADGESEDEEEHYGELGFVSPEIWPVDEYVAPSESSATETRVPSSKNRRIGVHGDDVDDKVNHGQFSKFNHLFGL